MSDFFNRLRPYATEQIAVSGSPVVLDVDLVNNTANYPDFKAAGVVLAVKSNGIYYTLDGSTPSNTNGIPLAAGDMLTLAGYQKIKNFKAIAQGSDAVLDVQYFKN